MKITPGRILIYRESEDEVSPAIVTKVNDDGSVNLTVFRDNHTPHPRASVEVTEDGDVIGTAAFPKREEKNGDKK